MPELLRVDLAEEADVLTVGVAHDVVAIRLFRLGQDISVRGAVGFGPVADPVSLSGEARGLAPVGLNGPRTVGIPPDIRPVQELGELLADLHGLEDGGLLVEDTVDFDQVGGSVADTPDIVSGAGGGALLVSDLALNNINSISEVPIKRYIEAGIDVVLGTDGHGMYSTFGEQEVVLATAAGLEPEDFEKIKETETKVISRALERETEHPRIEDISVLYSNVVYSTPDGQPRYTEKVAQQHREKKENVAKYLDEKIAHTGAITDEQKIEEDTKGKIPIMITGASKNAWPNILPEDQEKIALTMQVLANVLDCKTAYIITGGTNFGAEKTMHEAVHRRNEKGEEKLVLLGTFTMEAALDGEKGIEKDTITHAKVLEADGKRTQNWMDLPDTQLVYTQERNGDMIALGGGSIVSDIIQRGYNLGVDMHLMDGPNGASTEKSESLAGNNYSFKTIEELLRRLYERNPNMFQKEFSLEKIDRYVKEAKLEIMKVEKEKLETERKKIEEAEKLVEKVEGRDMPIIGE